MSCCVCQFVARWGLPHGERTHTPLHPLSPCLSITNTFCICVHIHTLVGYLSVNRHRCIPGQNIASLILSCRKEESQEITLKFQDSNDFKWRSNGDIDLSCEKDPNALFKLNGICWLGLFLTMAAGLSWFKLVLSWLCAGLSWSCAGPKLLLSN